MMDLTSFALGLAIGEDETYSRKKKQVDNPWNTGTPTEDGLYLTVIRVDNCYAYEPVFWESKWCFRHYDKPIIAWQKIEPYKEKDK